MSDGRDPRRYAGQCTAARTSGMIDREKPTFRHPNAWPREIRVRGERLPISDRENMILRDALTEYAEKACHSTTWKHITYGLMHFLVTGRQPKEIAEVREWRKRVLANDRGALLTLQEIDPLDGRVNADAEPHEESEETKPAPIDAVEAAAWLK